MFHVEPERQVREEIEIPELAGVPLFVNIPAPIRTDADLARAEQQEVFA